MSWSGREASRMFVCGWEALPDVREWSGAPPGYPGVVGRTPGCPCVVGRPSRMSRIGREALLDIQEFPQMSVCGWEAFPDVQEWSG